MHPTELLETVLEGNAPSDTDLKALANAFPKEGQWHEWKGRGLSGQRDCTAEIRKALSSFANAEGGLLVLGYDEGSRVFDGFPIPGGVGAEEWIRSVLTKFATIPTPRVFTLTVDGSSVVVVGIARSEVLVAVTDSGSQKYYLRDGEGTITVPPYLVLDLMVGRRRQPVLGVSLKADVVDDLSQSQKFLANHVRFHRLQLTVTIRNDSLVHVDDLLVGLVLYQVGAPGMIEGALREAIDDRDIPQSFEPFWTGRHLEMVHRPAFAAGLAPFEVQKINPSTIVLPSARNLRTNRVPGMETGHFDPRVIGGRLCFSAALYVLARNVAPQWHQVEICTQQLAHQEAVSTSVQRTRARPLVGVEFTDRAFS